LEIDTQILPIVIVILKVLRFARPNTFMLDLRNRSARKIKAFKISARSED
jgi:hypothetical protein